MVVFPGGNTSHLNWKKKYKDVSLSTTVLLINSVVCFMVNKTHIHF